MKSPTATTGSCPDTTRFLRMPSVAYTAGNIRVNCIRTSRGTSPVSLGVDGGLECAPV
jgi:hypothetical protein